MPYDTRLQSLRLIRGWWPDKRQNNAVNPSGYIFGDSALTLLGRFSVIGGVPDGPPPGYL